MARAALERLIGLYSPDAIISNTGQPALAGLEAILEFWQRTFRQFRVHLEPEVREVIAFGDAAIVRGMATGTLVPHGGSDPIEVDTWFLQVWRAQTDGGWLLWRGANGPNPAHSPSSPKGHSPRT
jgi:ketosteroid isomerase-like protein